MNSQGSSTCLKPTWTRDSTLPRYMTGSNPTDGAAATMGGLSMLMSPRRSCQSDSVVNYDEGVTRPFMTALYRWNMALTDDPDIKGDFEIRRAAHRL